MLIRLIGTVSIIDNGIPVAIKAPKPAGVLAALASRPGTPVARGELIERVWGADPPGKVSSVLYTYIARLRSMLRDADPDVSIDRTVRHGYTLNLAEDRIDVHRIRRLVAEATELKGTDDRAALERLRRAAELADGPALRGMVGRWADAFRAGFHRERLGLLADRYRLELAAGRHADIVDELVDLVASEGTAEPLVAALMLAYHRSGRSSDALELFETTRARLQDELGADPSPQLQGLHRQLLRQDSDLALSVEASTPVRPVPAQLPADTVAFTGREPELARLDVLSRSPRANPAALVGVGGVGKTALAVHWAHANRRRFPDGQIYVNLRGYDREEPVAPIEALGRLLIALGFSGSDIPDDVAAAGDLYRSATADRRMVVVLDNAGEAAQVRPLLPGRGCFTIVTSRDRLTGLAVLDDAQLIRLGVLSARQSTALLTRLLAGSDAEAASRLAQLCGNLPLALRIAAARIAESPSAEMARYADELADRDRLELLSIPDDPDSAVAANLDLSFHRLPEAAKSLFCRLGTLPGEDFSAELISAVSKEVDSSEDETDGLLRTLVTAHLLEEHRKGRYRMHDLVRLYAAQRATADMSQVHRDTLTDAFIEWHHGREFVASAAEEGNIFRAAHVLRDHPRLWRLVLPLRNIVNVGRSLDRITAMAQRGLEQAEIVGDGMGVFRMTNLLSSVAYKRGASADAVELGRRAITKARDLGEAERAIAHGNLAIYQGTAADLAGSIELYETAIGLLNIDEHAHQLAVFYNGLVTALLQVGRFTDVDAHLARFEEVCTVTATASAQGWLRVNRAEMLACAGRFDEALTEADAAVDIADRHHVAGLGAFALHRRADTLLRAGWPDLALRNNDSEHQWTLAHGMTAMTPNTTLQRAELMTQLARYREAIELVAEVRSEKLANTPFSQPRVMLILAIAHNGLSDPHTALAFAREAADRYGAMPWPARREQALWAVADAYARIGDVDTAHECLVTADRISSPANRRLRHRMRREPEHIEADRTS